MSEKPHGNHYEWLIWLALAVVIVLAFNADMSRDDERNRLADQRDVISFGAASDMRVQDAVPGGWIEMDIPVIKHRDCKIIPDLGGPVLFYNDDSVGVSLNWVRNGPLLAPVPNRWQTGAIKFRLPLNAPVGRAAVVFEAHFQCEYARPVVHRSPAAEFEVLQP